MKIIKKIISLFFFFSLLMWVNYTYADWEWTTKEYATKVKITEKMPKTFWICKEEPDSDWYYECTIKPQFESVLSILTWFIQYFTFLTVLVWVFFIVLNSILIIMSWIDSQMKEDAKARMIKTISWLVLLLLSWVILNAVAPWVYRLNI